MIKIFIGTSEYIGDRVGLKQRAKKIGVKQCYNV